MEMLPRIVYLLPGNPYGGGAHSVVQDAYTLKQSGWPVSIAVERKYLSHYKKQYKYLDRLTLIGCERFEDLVDELCGSEIIIATAWFTISALALLKQHCPQITPAYYIQDYEPNFYTAGSAEYSGAKASYKKIPGIFSLVKTQWLKQKIETETSLRPHLIRPSINTDIYFPEAKGANSKVHISAMVRPQSVHRNPEGTLLLLNKLKLRYGKDIEIHLFGCRKGRSFRALNVNFKHRFMGRLRQHEVARLLRDSDIFIDYSKYQAFGRTALEAMACGCAVAVTDKGGTATYVRDLDNALFIDPDDWERAYHRVCLLVDDKALRAKLASEAQTTARGFSMENAASSLLQAFQRCLQEKQNQLRA